MTEIRAEDMLGMFQAMRDEVVADKARLTALDGRFGDGDLGVNMQLGFDAVCSQLNAYPQATSDAALRQAGMALNAAAPSTLGTLLACALMAMAEATRGEQCLGTAQWATAMRAGQRAIERLGKSAPGDKTLLDAWIPYADALEEADLPLPEAARHALLAAEQGAQNTANIPARVGRAAMFSEQSIGTPDGGAMAFAALMRGFTRFVETIFIHCN